MLSQSQIKSLYDRLGAGQDREARYEDAAFAELIGHMKLGQALSVGEIGCGTGRLAERLLLKDLPDDARYWGVDISDTMVALTKERLRAFEDRVTVELGDGSAQLKNLVPGFDAFLGTYVLDLMPNDDITRTVSEVLRVLKPGGMFGAVSLARGQSAKQKVMSSIWSMAYRLSPGRVGGCRPLKLNSYFDRTDWLLRHNQTVSAAGVASEIVVAQKK